MRLRKTIFGASILLSFVALWPTSTLVAQDHSEGNEQHDEVLSNTEQNSSSEAEHAESHEEEKFNATEVIMDHIKDSHDWHLWTTKHGHHVSVPLPIIVFSKNSGLNIFMSSKIAHGHNHKGFEMGEGIWLTTNKKGDEVEKSLKGKIVEVDAHGEMVAEGLPLDFSITKNVFMMFLAFVILLVVFLGLARSYKKVGVSAPKGMQGFLEPIIVFIEEDVAKPNIGEEKYKKYMPYLLTVFFFILIHNMMGLIPFFPFGANVTGNIAVTMVLALCTVLITNVGANKAYWKHMFMPPGVPFWLYPIMIPVELLGIITKPFALMIRLFANITAGHIIILSLVSMIFIFKSVFMAVPAGILVLFMDMIEILVAFLQAYIFTLLSALFIGLAVPEAHHD